MHLLPPAGVQRTRNPDCSNTNPPLPEPLNAGEDGFDAGTITCVEGLVYAIVGHPHSQEEREDCMQEALLGFWQAMRKEPGQPRVLYLSHCRFSIRDSLKHGRSVDSPKRRWLGYSIDDTEDGPISQNVAALVSNIDPLQYASANDALEQMRVRLSIRDQTILQLLLEGNGTREIARRLKTSHSVVCRARTHIQSVALEIGLFPINKGVGAQN
jgi:RNA polymerase sigma factor (sigma-70 family)